ncbi:MAG: complex I subunit 5 family protein [Candidatus Heimdallarchaeaceae archaeon]|jgi:proton-translocating NADH-quinone oxidoreductase chain N
MALDTYLSLIMLVPIVGAGLIALIQQLKKYLVKIKICADCVNHALANLVALGVFLLGITSVFSANWRIYLDLNSGLLLEYGIIQAVMVTIFSFLVWMAVLFSVSYMKGKEGLGYYYALILTLLTGLSAVIMANNFITLFIGWEMFALSAYVLVAFDRVKRGAVEASLKYFIMSTAGSMLVLLATALTYGYFGSVDYSDIAVAVAAVAVNMKVVGLIIALFITGFAVTAAMLFLNAWLPDAHSSAPSTISALLSGIVVKAGAFGMYRTLYSAYPDFVPAGVVLSWIGILTMIEGNFLVFSQFLRKDIVDFKRILAYSTTVHLGYIILGIGSNTMLGVQASVFHILTHSIGKGSLFLLSGTLIAAVGSRDIRDMTGIGRRSPFIGIILTIGLLSLGGIPITAGFISKLMVVLATFNGAGAIGNNIALVVLAIINSLLALGGYLYILKIMLFDEPVAKAEEKVKIPLFQMVSLTILAVVILLFGFWPNGMMQAIAGII